MIIPILTTLMVSRQKKYQNFIGEPYIHTDHIFMRIREAFCQRFEVNVLKMVNRQCDQCFYFLERLFYSLGARPQL